MIGLGSRVRLLTMPQAGVLAVRELYLQGADETHWAGLSSTKKGDVWQIHTPVANLMLDDGQVDRPAKP